MTIQDAIGELIEGKALSKDQMISVMDQIMSGSATDAQIGGLLVALRLKGESVDEISGAVEVMREKATSIENRHDVVVDTCGTGGDHSGTFNISTAAAFAVSGAGLCVAKHGNRAASSLCGSADVLRALGVNVEASPETVSTCLNEVGLGFLFAPALHGAMKYAIGPRRELGIRTIFNVLGPLTNPAGARHQVIGVYSGDLTATLAEVLNGLGSERAFVVHGSDGLDEMTTTGATRVSELSNGAVTTYEVKPEDFDMESVNVDALKGGDEQQNAAILLEVLEGKSGPRQDIVALNAGAAIAAGGLAEDISAGVKLARASILSGKAMEKLEGLKRVSNA